MYTFEIQTKKYIPLKTPKYVKSEKIHRRCTLWNSPESITSLKIPLLYQHYLWNKELIEAKILPMIKS